MGRCQVRQAYGGMWLNQMAVVLLLVGVNLSILPSWTMAEPPHPFEVARQAELTTSDGVAHGLFGASIDISEDTMAPNDTTGGNASQGLARVFGSAGLMHTLTTTKTGPVTPIQTVAAPSICPSGSCTADAQGNTITAQDQSCSDISGNWNFTDSGTVTCTIAGETDTEAISGSGTIDITQNGCNVIWDVDNYSRSGSVSGNTIQVSGVFLVPLVGGVYFTQNSFTASGTINEDETRIELNGSGVASGTYEGMGFSCAGTDKAIFSRLRLEKLDGIDFRSGSDITTDLNKLATGGHPVLGAATDGATKLLLRLNVDQPGSVRFSLQGTRVPAQDGILRSIDGTQAGDTIRVNTVATDLGQKAFAIFESPNRFVRAGFGDEGSVERTLDVDVTFTPSSSGSPSSIPSTIKLVRPPIIMIHGIWSSEHEWDVFQSNLQRALPGIRMFPADYHEHNGSHFSTNVLIPRLEIFNAQQQLRSTGIAMVRADVFGHSMGGVLSRIWAEDSQYKRDENFNKGDINKLVTIDSPHFGSHVANFLLDTLQWLQSSYPPIADRVLKWASASGHPLDQGAVEDLTTYSYEIGIMNATFTDLPSHAIVGDVQQLHVDLSYLPAPIGVIFGILKYFGFNTSSDIIPGASDLIVSAQSQAGGLTPPTSSTFYHMHTEATKSADVASKAVELLNLPPDSASFRQGWPVGIVPQSLLGFELTIQREIIASIVAQSTGIQITAPPDGSTVASGQTVTVTVQPVSGFPLSSVLLVIPDFVQELTAPPFTFDLTIPNSAVGPLTILALGKDAAGTVFTSDEITVNVQPNATLQSLSVNPTEFFFPGIGFQKQISVMGVYSDGIKRDLTSAGIGTTYLSDNSGVVSVDVNGLMKAEGSGVATVIVSNSGEFATAVTVTVQPTGATPFDHTLTVTKTGTGTGRVTGPGINCGSDCQESYATGTPVALTATPDPGSVFSGFSDDPDCADGQVTMDTDKHCTATFTLAPATLPDLTGSWSSVTQSCRKGKCTLKGSVRVVNQGNVIAPASRLRVVLSEDAVLDGSDLVVKESSIKKLKPGRATTSKIKIKLPPGVTAAGKYLFAVLDALSSVAELDETNNTPMAGPVP